MSGITREEDRWTQTVGKHGLRDPRKDKKSHASPMKLSFNLVSGIAIFGGDNTGSLDIQLPWEMSAPAQDFKVATGAPIDSTTYAGPIAVASIANINSGSSGVVAYVHRHPATRATTLRLTLIDAGTGIPWAGKCNRTVVHYIVDGR